MTNFLGLRKSSTSLDVALVHQYAIADTPLRAELFNAEQMGVHGTALARSHRVASNSRSNQLMSRLIDNYGVLLGARSLLQETIKNKETITPAGEWLLDNFHLIEEQIRTARANFPRGYGRELPILNDELTNAEPSVGMPRVYAIALEAVAHGDGRIDPESLNRFVRAYQSVVNLKLGELWAIPIMLRFALIENLRRVSARVLVGMANKNLAAHWAETMISTAQSDPKSLILVIADMARSNPPMVNSFVAELVRRLQGHSTALALPLTWISQRLAESNQTIDQLVQAETQRQAANQLSISNTITGLRFVGSYDWRDFVGAMSEVEHILSTDPMGYYSAMDFPTRDHYRHQVEAVAKKAKVPEIAVAQIAVDLASLVSANQAIEPTDPKRHVGYYLIDQGLDLLEARVEQVAPIKPAGLARWVQRLQSRKASDKRASLHRNSALYLIIIAFITLFLTLRFIQHAQASGLAVWAVVMITIPALFGASQLAVALSNWIATLLSRPKILPRMDYSKGIANEARALVIVPTLITSFNGIANLCESLEVRFLANRDSNLRFGLLTDFCDAATETLPDDSDLLDSLSAMIGALNKKYLTTVQTGVNDSGQVSYFYLFHRKREWNDSEQVWMGYERKRGKLSALNKLLLTGDQSAFETIVGDCVQLVSTTYVITLDTDTQLPRDCARNLVATMAHPLNRPRFDTQAEIVSAGFGILQPRVTASVASKTRSRYSDLWSNEMGIDPYTRAVSDVYQDLFEEGSFVGKGVYDVAAFERSLGNRFPENRILSHDLLEGCHARAGLVSDVQLYEEYPNLYSADVSRRYRWIRGDWQIAAWLFNRTPANQKNPLSTLSRWKILDNLRRSLVSVAMMLLFVIGWALIQPSWQWTLSVLSVMFLTPVVTAAIDVLRKGSDVSVAQHIQNNLRSAWRQLCQTLFNLACLPFEAYFSVDAIFRTLVRVHFTHRRLLEWRASAQTVAPSNSSATIASELKLAWQAMWISPAAALVIGLFLAIKQPMSLLVAAPILLLWFLSPVIVWWMGRPVVQIRIELTPDQAEFLRPIARKTWRYFETFVTKQNNWLPPDNYQEHPVAVVAHRTSPTNMGLSLLANLAAYDFAYISTGVLVDRTRNALEAMQSLERFEGHFYNWYDTITMLPLAPRYVSTVDSGNLSGHLLTLASGLLDLIDQKFIPDRTFEGIWDTYLVLQTEFITNGTAAPYRSELANAQLLNEIKERVNKARRTGLISIASAVLSLSEIQQSAVELQTLLSLRGETTRASTLWWIQALVDQCNDALGECENLDVGISDRAIPTLKELPSDQARQRITTLRELAKTVAQMAIVKYGFLYDTSRRLLAVGYNVDHRRRDSGHYDLLASEARLASFVAIAQNGIPQENWFALGRRLTGGGASPVLLSWSGSMFEYLMPTLVMPMYENTLLERTCVEAVNRQIAYGKSCGIPWGISESGYNVVDAALNYQYLAFGVPSLGLKRGDKQDLVIAPYASALALMALPQAACQNLQRLSADGFEGEYGFYEAIDFTPSRVPRGQKNAVVRSFMVHHQAMSLLSYAYVLLDQPMQKRFEANLEFQATLLLLQEAVPLARPFYFGGINQEDAHVGTISPQMPLRIITTANTPIPEIQLLSNGNYHVMVTNSGGGYSRWRDLSVTRWREDSTKDNWGTFFYLLDVTTNTFWSTAHQPTVKTADSYEAIFSEGRAEFKRTDLGYETHTEIVVSPEDDIEMRRMRITNHSRISRVIELTSYCEVVVAPSASDASHCAFSNLFVQTEILKEYPAVVCTRRPRSTEEQPPCMFATMIVRDVEVETATYETDRCEFIGRTRSLASPAAMRVNKLRGSQGSVLDPIIAIRYRITLQAKQTATIDWVCGIAPSRDGALHLIGKYCDKPLADRVFNLAWTHSWINLRQINASETDAQLFGRIAGSILYANASMRAPSNVLIRNRRGQSGLWGYAISGDLPIVLVQVSEIENIDFVRQMVLAHSYWRLKGLAVDLVIWNEDRVGYRQVLQEQIMGIVAASSSGNLSDQKGGIFVRVAEQISAEDRLLFQTVARVVLSDTKGTLAEQVEAASIAPQFTDKARASNELRPSSKIWPLTRSLPLTRAIDSQNLGYRQAAENLLFSSPMGGFSADGREYVINTSVRQTTPAPWVNILANTHFGSVISESGSAYTWSENAHGFRLSPWSNDPVSDISGEAIYIRDEQSGFYWSPTPLPCSSGQPYQTRHGFGYSKFIHDFDGIASELTVYVDINAAVKYSVLKLRNHSVRSRELSVTGFVEWVLGDLKHKSQMHLVTQRDAVSGALFAFNPYSLEFSQRTAFFDTLDAASFTADRAEFLGRNGSMARPEAMQRTDLSNKVGVGMDSCAALRVSVDLPAGMEKEIVFRLGALGNSARTDTKILSGAITALQSSEVARLSLAAVKQYWDQTLGTIQVTTPDHGLNVLCNGWLMYQTIACRLWARSGFYQSGGAYGFRDQLQDSLAVIHSRPELVREHLLRCAAHQFLEGDVQHWWHPPSGQGVRTRCSDDYLWLPQAVARYVKITGDTAVLVEDIHYIEGRRVNPTDDSYYDLPTISSQRSSLYQHCVRAIENGLTFGIHGLPLMGSGDWNDGMNLVGIEGKGESVWLGFFLFEVLNNFAEVARLHDDIGFSERCLIQAQLLQKNIEEHSWDGHWYRRAYFDNGRALGSADNEECQIDAISQSWSVLSGAGSASRSKQAMNELSDRLVDREHGVVKLLVPPFDKSDLNPGYIKGYLPGVRENGGQYTHSAIWSAMAFAKQQDAARAWEVFNMINPIRHGGSASDVIKYKVEPYVMAADVYAVAPHIGRGGWTWYTGSAGWMYRLIVESLLGLRIENGRLYLTPCIPESWSNFSMTYQFKSGTYQIEYKQLFTDNINACGLTMMVDGTQSASDGVLLRDDHNSHRVLISQVKIKDSP